MRHGALHPVREDRGWGEYQFLDAHIEMPIRPQAALERYRRRAAEYGAAFEDAAVASAYRNRPPYPPELFTLLHGLIVEDLQVVLDLGCGTGDVARGLAARVDRVDAVDRSAAMVGVGKTLPGGSAPNLRWFCESAEEFRYRSTYSLVVAAESLGWMNWELVLPLIRAALSANGRLAIVGRRYRAAWAEELQPLMPQYSTIHDFVPYDVADELQIRDLFKLERRAATQFVPFAQSVEDYVEFWHSRAGFARERLGQTQANAFGEDLRRILSAHASHGILSYDVGAELAWGIPTSGKPKF